jgi:ferredoxin-type protein NapF
MREASVTRREFFTGGASPACGGPYPPGVTESSLRNCTGCGACAEVCPTQIISLRAGRPYVDFSEGECTFCGRCAEQCPERVFPPEPATEFQHHAAIGDNCLAINFVDCQACRDVCSQMAIRFKPRVGGPFVPTLDHAACTGCGACLAVCPVSAVSMVPRAMEAEHA